MNKKILLLLPALAMVLAGCNKNNSSQSGQESQSGSSSEQQVSVQSVTVTPAEAEVEEHMTLNLSATVKPISLPSDKKEVTWSSSDPEVALVNASGVVTGVSASETPVTITATSKADSSKKGTASITVKKGAPYKVLAAPELDKDFRFGTYQVGLSKRIFFNGQFESYPRGLTTESWADAAKVRFEEAGEEGKYYVSYMDGSDKMYLGMNDSHRFGGYSSNTSDDTVWDWDASLKTITKTITKDDKETVYFPGTYNEFTTISGCDIAKVADDYIFQFLYIDGTIPVEQVVISGENEVYQGETLQLTALLEPMGAEGTVEWSISGNEKVHIDSETGLVSADADAVAESTAIVKATCGTIESEEFTVTVKQDKLAGAVLVDNPTTGKVYKVGIETKGYAPVGKNLFMTGGKNSWRLATTQKFAESGDFELVEATGGYKLKMTEPGKTAKFLQVAVATGTNNRDFNLVEEADASVFTYNTTFKTLVINLTGHSTSSNDGDYTIGAYDNKGSINNVNLQSSKFSFLTEENCDVTQFPIHFYTLGE